MKGNEGSVIRWRWKNEGGVVGELKKNKGVMGEITEDKGSVIRRNRENEEGQVG